ncbi:TolC family outer membrane protein [Rhodoferax sp. AJA081-3]|uniref:TolC family outer membrane protein n=1 Tax=Rhodoferax sp. AJA081-3 TaxID=2752316 RepID=UPI001ADF8A8C|nr:TolC family outer membrane protein [Rhodoferax sp. AJA081-3]QTN26885.1 TolC family outer membrane protein [Rhodoferax sp. AJA081-3]
MTKLTAISTAALIASASFSPWVLAQQSPGTLKEAVERAILQNPEVKLRFHNLEAAKAERGVAQGAWLPRIDLEVAGGTYETKTPSLASALSYNGNRASLQLRQTLFDGFATLHETRRLSYAQQAAYYDLLASSNQIALEAARAYTDVLRFRELVQLAADNFTTHQEVHDRLSQKVTAGVGRKVDLEQAAGRMALAESNWLTESSNLHDVSARYQRLVGQLPAANLAATESMGQYLKAGAGFPSEAVRSNPEFLSAVATIRGYRSDSSMRRAAYSPTVEFRARQSMETNQSGINGDYRDTALEVVLSYNLYRGGSDKARVNQAVAKLNSAYDLRDKACRDVWQTGEIAFNDSQRLAAQIKLLSQHELSTSKARQAYQQQFDIGQRSLLDLLDTENELYQARRALANAEYDLQLSAVRVLATSGTLLSTLKLQTLSTETPDASGNTQDDDALMQCDHQVPTAPALDRSFNSRPASLPADPGKPVTGATTAVPVALPPSNPTADICNQLPKAVQTWLEAWNKKDVPGYLGAYASSFDPGKAMDRKQWEAMRTSRISKQGDISITIGKVSPVRCDNKTAEVAFSQEYGSVNYKDSVNKTLALENVKGVWKITRETVTKGRSY